jgi:carbon starvation protein
MSSLFIVLFGLVGFTFGWFVYSKFIAEKIYRLDSNYVTPAHKFEDGIDYVPTNKFVLWGSHFTAVVILRKSWLTLHQMAQLLFIITTPPK